MSKIDKIETFAPTTSAEREPSTANDREPIHQPGPSDRRPPIAEAPAGAPAARADSAGAMRPPAIAPEVAPRRRATLRTILIGRQAFWSSWRGAGAELAARRPLRLHRRRLRAGRQAVVSTDVSGIVSSVDVREGQVVKAGDLLFQVDPRQFRIALDSASANLAQTALTIESMKANYKTLLSDIAAQEAQVVARPGGLRSRAALVHDDTCHKATYDQARFALAGRPEQARIAAASGGGAARQARGNPDIPAAEHPLYLQAKAQVDEAQRQLDHASVRAPFDGVVTQVDALQPGTYLVSQTAALTNTGAVALVSTDRSGSPPT